MAGYKETVKRDQPVAFLTFDGDAFDSVNRNLMVPIGQPMVIIDEMGMQNPGILHSDDHGSLYGYRMGMTSLVEHEQTDQYSISFGFYGQMNAHPNLWAKAFIEIPHSASFSFITGSFCIECLLFRQNSSDAGTTGYSSYTRPIFEKQNVFRAYWNHATNNNNLFIIHPGGTMSFPNSVSNIYNTIGRIIHFVFNWEIKNLGGNLYQGIATAYINGYKVKENVYNYSDTYPSSNFNSSILLGGRTGINRQHDFHTSNFQMDQVAIYNKSLSEEQVINHFKKIFPYHKMIVSQFPANYWTFADVRSTVNFSVQNEIGTGYTGTYVGSRQIHFDREQEGPPNIPLSTCSSFANGGMASFERTNSTNTYITTQINDNYTYELWFNITQNTRGVILACQSFKFPFNGLLLQINMRNNQNVVGSVQFNESINGVILNSKVLNEVGNSLRYNEGKWHHCVITRNNTLNRIQLWLDGELHDSQIAPTVSVSQPGQITVMNSMPGLLHCNGKVSNLAQYSYELTGAMIRSRFSYGVIYRIRGIVTLLGIPYRARLRFYKSATGEFLQEMDSDINTGEYIAYFLNNSKIDILVFSPFDLSVRYRAYGPVTPAEIEDLPYNI